MLPQTDISYLLVAMVAYDLVTASLMFKMVQGVRLHRTLDYSIEVVRVSVKSLFTILFSHQLI